MTPTAPAATADTLGAYIRAKREAATPRMSQEALGALIGKPQHVVSEYERDKRTPGSDVLRELAQHLPGCDAAQLLALVPPTGPR